MAEIEYERTTWEDRVVETPLTYSYVVNDDGTVTLTPVTGTVTSEGTKVTSARMNNIEEGIVNLVNGINNLDVNLDFCNIQVLEDNDFDNCKESGIYSYYEGESPYTHDILIVFAPDDISGFIYQVKFECTESTSSNTIYARFYNGNSFTSWDTIYEGLACFTGDTLIKTTSGYIAIDKLSVGDTIYSYNEENNKVEQDEVLYIKPHKNIKNMIKLSIGMSDILVTPEHKIRIGNKYKSVRGLKVGDIVNTFSFESFSMVKKIERIETNITGYDIDTKNHNYFVGTNEVLAQTEAITIKESEELNGKNNR